MYRVSFYLKITFFVLLSLPSMASEPQELLNQKLTELLRPNWPYEAFLAIPRISEMRPTLAIEISKEDSSSYTSSCIEIFYSELQKKFESKTLLERDSLHKLLCKAMKRTVEKTPIFLITQKFPEYSNIALSFDFFNGLIRVVEMPYPPLDPLLKLENVFLDENVILSFGNINFPDDLELEINQTPL